MSAVAVLVGCVHFEDGPIEACGICRPRQTSPLRRRTPQALRGATEHEKWIHRRTERQRDGELPFGFDSSDDRACWNAYNHYGALEFFEEALGYLRRMADTEAIKGFAICLKLDGLGKPADWL